MWGRLGLDLRHSLNPQVSKPCSLATALGLCSYLCVVTAPS